MSDIQESISMNSQKLKDLENSIDENSKIRIQKEIQKAGELA